MERYRPMKMGTSPGSGFWGLGGGGGGSRVSAPGLAGLGCGADWV